MARASRSRPPDAGMDRRRGCPFTGGATGTLRSTHGRRHRHSSLHARQAPPALFAPRTAGTTGALRSSPAPTLVVEFGRPPSPPPWGSREDLPADGPSSITACSLPIELSITPRLSTKFTMRGFVHTSARMRRRRRRFRAPKGRGVRRPRGTSEPLAPARCATPCTLRGSRRLITRPVLRGCASRVPRSVTETPRPVTEVLRRRPDKGNPGEPGTPTPPPPGRAPSLRRGGADRRRRPGPRDALESRAGARLHE